MVEYAYDTWGKKVTTTGSLAGTLGLFQPFRYRGYVYDFETGFYYLQSRYYDPATGRFISADILLSTGQGVLGHNCYAYCRDNPSSRYDSKGESDEKVVYIFYTSYSSSESSNGEGDFTLQAEYYKEKLEEKGYIVYLKETNTVDDFILQWNSLKGKEISEIYIFSHGNGNSLIFQNGKGISCTGYNLANEPIDAISDLERISVSSLWLMSCNSGHLDLYHETNNNVAAAFCRLGTIDSVYAYNGSMGYGPKGGERFFSWSPRSNLNARLASDQSGYDKVYTNFGIKNRQNDPSGWVRYYLMRK